MIDPQKVDQAMLDCLYRQEELDDPTKPPEGAVLAEGIQGKFGFHPERLEAKRAQVQAWLAEMPEEFHEGSGDGWSFLNMCTTRDGVQWTGEHRRLEQLVVMAIGLGLAKYTLERAFWPGLPGGMPYIVILKPKDSSEESDGDEGSDKDVTRSETVPE